MAIVAPESATVPAPRMSRRRETAGISIVFMGLPSDVVVAIRMTRDGPDTQAWTERNFLGNYAEGPQEVSGDAGFLCAKLWNRDLEVAMLGRNIYRRPRARAPFSPP